MIKPDFIILGTQKAGTTSLAFYLSQHKDIHISDPKEPNWLLPEEFNQKKEVETEEEYSALFKKGKVNGEASVHYFLFLDKIDIKDKKVIVILRDPIKRIISMAKFDQKHKEFYGTSLKEYVEKFEKLYNTRRPIEFGLYLKGLKSIYKQTDKVKIIIFEDFIKNEEKITKETIEWLGLSPEEYIFKKEILNKTKIPKNKIERFYIKNIDLIKKYIRKYRDTKIGLFLRNMENKIISGKTNFIIEKDYIEELKEFYKKENKGLKEFIEEKGFSSEGMETWY
jgi:hypothetical protein